jgi:hypothetical protein
VTRAGNIVRSMRGAALFAAGTLAVHELRFLLGGHGSEDGVVAGHASMGALVPWLVLLLAAAAGGFLARLALAWRRGDAGADGRAPFLPLWAASSGGLLALHALHECLEGIVLRGGPGVPGLLAAEGLFAVLAALLVGGLVALALRGARALISRVGRRSRAVIAAPAGPRLAPPPRHVPRLLAAPLAGSAAGRAPPAPAPVA